MAYVIFGIAAIVLLFCYLVLPQIIKKRQLPVEQEILWQDNNDINLFTLNGIGNRLMGKFRVYNDTYATYSMLTIFFLPILPVGCYRVEDVIDDNVALFESKYKIYGKTNSIFWEILHIYLSWYGWIALTIGFFFVLV